MKIIVKRHKTENGYKFTCNDNINIQDFVLERKDKNCMSYDIKDLLKNLIISSLYVNLDIEIDEIKEEHPLKYQSKLFNEPDYDDDLGGSKLG